MSNETTPTSATQPGKPGGEVARAGGASGARFLFPRPVAWLVLALSLAATTGGWWIARNHAELAARKTFEQEANRIAAALTERMLIYQDVLHGAVGLYAASYSVERHEWRAYVEKVSIEQRFPGIDAIGFVAYVPREGLAEFLKTTREDQTPDFEVKNLGSGPDFLIIKYLEPERRHRKLLGWDTGNDPPRRAAAEKARDTGAAVSTGTLILREDEEWPRQGFLMMLPVYANGAATSTVAERRAAIRGWVYARFVVQQLVLGILGTSSPVVSLKIVDCTVPDQEKVIFDERASAPSGSGRHGPRFSSQIPVDVGGCFWRLVFATKPGFEASISQDVTVLAAAGGGALSLLLFGIAWSLGATRKRALALASAMTTQLRAVNERLEHERYLLGTLMENLPDRIYFKDLQSRFMRNNRAHLKRFGLTDPAQAQGKTDFDFFTDEHARQAFEDEQRVIRTSQPITKEEMETWPDGSTTWALSTKMPLCNEEGALIGTFGISRDITARRRAESALLKAKEAAEEASRAKSQFLASMSHELRTPLNSIIGFANILRKNKSGALSAAELDFLERIQANGKHLLGLISQILDLSKIEAHKVELELGPVALDVLVRETLAQEEGLLPDKEVRLVADLPAKVAPLRSDAEKLKQIIINLIGNALKFTERGTVTVRVLTDPADDRPLRLEVTDTGIGIPREKLGVIFEAFHQAETGTARKYGGTGLGLTISQALCQLMGYNIEVSSEVGKGSTFALVFEPPGAASGAETVVSGARAPTGKAARGGLSRADGLTGKWILVIDDEPGSRALLARMLEDFGCRVVCASSGEEGLRRAQELRPDLITLDLLMPQVDGLQTVRLLKAEPKLRDIPVVVVSLVASENRGRILGAVDVLQKPVEREELLAVLKRNLLPPKPRVLVVDDDQDARRLLASGLEGAVAETRTAANGTEALELMQRYTPDLVLLDLVMPVMDGMVFLQIIRADPRYQHLPVVVITAKELSTAETEQLRKQTQSVLKKSAVFQADLHQVLLKAVQAAARRQHPPGSADPRL